MTVKIKERLKKRIYKLAKESKKSTSYHLNKALENYIGEIDELRISLARLNDRSDKVMSSKEFKKSIGL
jgi:RHH-type rel operon transcriptional repressor/antitoxin RelB